jgi:C-methyltransferase
MKFIIHDWDDEKSVRIFKTCKKAMNANTKLLIVERVIEGESDFVGQFYDLHMKVMVGGRERSEPEFSTLLRQAGLRLNRIILTKSPLRLIEVTY